MASLTRWTLSGWTLGVGDGQAGLACCDSWGRKESDTTERLNWTELILGGWDCPKTIYLKRFQRLFFSHVLNSNSLETASNILLIYTCPSLYNYFKYKNYFYYIYDPSPHWAICIFCWDTYIPYVFIQIPKFLSGKVTSQNSMVFHQRPHQENQDIHSSAGFDGCWVAKPAILAHLFYCSSHKWTIKILCWNGTPHFESEVTQSCPTLCDSMD